jgi:hypothetical protein
MNNRFARATAVGLALMAAFLMPGGSHVAADEMIVLPETAPHELKGYLAKPLDSAALLPRPPADGSAAQALDSRSTSPIWRCKGPTAGSSPAATPTFLSPIQRASSPVRSMPR